MKIAHLTGRVDAFVGEQLERQIVAHHRRRLAKLGHERALSAAHGWATTASPPRAGNELEVLLDGAEALAEIADAIESARSSVWLAGWFFSPDFHLRSDSEMTLRDLLADRAERLDVRMLAWAGAPLPLFHPDRSEVREMRDAFATGTRIRIELDARERPFHCHHEKLVIVDGEIAFVGGIDLTTYAGNRLDDGEHPARGALGWHDAATRITGPAVADVAAHYRFRWHEVTGERLPETPAPPATGSTELQIVRTVPEKIYDALPRGEFSILESYLAAFRSAERLIYLENQFLWSPEIADVLADKLENPPDERFRLLVLLPAKPNNGADDTRGQLGQLAAAASAAPERFFACTLHQRGGDAKPVYVHAKIGIVDDRWLTIGSANLNEHSLFNDSEVNVVCAEPEIARTTRLRLWSEHLECSIDDVAGDPAELIDTRWRPLAEEQLEHRRRGSPYTHRLHALPNVSRRAAALRGPLSGLLVDG
ncbi:MAG TPA: phospholipase D family protein [Gaiellaceae bacterium]|jgi:phosphatidylserine/phosphatidylglycerophosphate/cardiolipin synthase-like enzyme